MEEYPSLAWVPRGYNISPLSSHAHFNEDYILFYQRLNKPWPVEKILTLSLVYMCVEYVLYRSVRTDKGIGWNQRMRNKNESIKICEVSSVSKMESNERISMEMREIERQDRWVKFKKLILIHFLIRLIIIIFIF